MNHHRTLLRELESWKNDPHRKPLIIRGARQVGKTTLIRMFAESFDHSIHLNLDKRADRQIIENHDDIQTILQLLLLREKITIGAGQSILLFIDEIQSSPTAVELLRYLYEEAGHWHVIAAGSLLESILGHQITFPVGRVEYRMLRPFSFSEYLMAAGEDAACKLLDTIPFPSYGHDRLLQLFHEYTLIGGMPEVVSLYLQNRDLVKTGQLFDSLITTYEDDVEKYAAQESERKIIRHIIHNAQKLAGERIHFEGFANSNYKSREVSEGFRTLTKTFLISLVYPTTHTILPIISNLRKAPRLHVLDTGIMNYFAGIQFSLLNNEHIDNVYEGRVVEHIVGQELLTVSSAVSLVNHFWVREKKQSNAEVDYVLQHDDLLIPLEVKSGKTGRLRSLMAFIDAAPHDFGVRISSAPLHIEQVKTLNGKRFTLVNLPIYLTSRCKEYISFYRGKE